MLSRAMIDQLRRRRVPLIGGGGGQWSFIHVNDVAAATVAAVERGEPGNIYNIVDDEPAAGQRMAAGPCPEPWSAPGRQYACRPGLAGCSPASTWFR